MGVVYELLTNESFPPCPLVVAFDGWVDAAGVGSGAVHHLAEGGTRIVEFDPDAMFDYRVNRPVVDFLDGRLSEMTLPEMFIDHATPGGVPLMLLRGTEPEFRWKALGAAVVELATTLRSTEMICVGAVPAAVPHTRSTRIMATSSVEGFVSSEAPPGVLRVPGAAVTNLEWHLAQSGMATYGFWAQVPHYVTGPYPQAMVTLIERVGEHLNAEFPLGDLPEDAMTHRSELDELATDSVELTAHLERLELLGDPDDLPTAEELGSEIEDFLRGEE